MSEKQQEEIRNMAYRLGTAEELLREAKHYINDYEHDGFVSEQAVKLKQMIEEFLEEAG